MSSLRSSNYSSDSINEVCTSTASLSVSSNPTREHDSPTVVSHSSSTAHSDQFDDAPEDHDPSVTPRKASMNPLDALAMACAVEKDHQQNHEEQLPPKTEEGAQTASFQISQNDVLCGRGGLTNHHPGNVFFRRLVRLKQESYLRASKREKAGVAKEIVDLIRNLTPPGRFLKKDPQNPGVWIEIGDRKAREKTSQALREGAPELREELQSEALQVGEKRGVVDGSRAIINSMRHHQAQSWQQQVGRSPTKPDGVNNNRVRVVSSDSDVLNLRALRQQAFVQSQPHFIADEQSAQHPFMRCVQESPYHHPQPMEMDESESTVSMRRPRLVGDVTIGIKRKSGDLGNLDYQPREKMPPQNEGGTRGPRLKLLKQRLQNRES